MILTAIRRLFFPLSVVVLAASAVHAQSNLYWNAPTGGAGLWNFAGNNWSTTTTGPASVAWNPNDGTLVANFGNAGGAVTLGNAMVVYGINFLTGPTTPTYSIVGSGGNTLTLGGVGNINADVAAAISAQIIGSVGLSKTGNGTLTLGGPNTYTGGTTVTSGYLFGNAQASGSPFSNGAITLNNAGIRLNGLASSTTTTTVGDLNVAAPNNTIGGLSTLIVDNTSATSTTFALNNLTRGGAGSVLVITPQTGQLSTGENVTFFNGNSMLSNNILPAWVVASASGANPAADFVGYGAGGVTVATYSSTDLASSVAADVVNQSTSPVIGGNVTAYALKTTAAINLGGNTLTLGNGSGQTGLILDNSSSITNGAINMGTTEGMIYAQNGPTLGQASDTTTVSSNGLNITSLDAGGITVNAAINDATAPSKLTITGVSPATSVTLNGNSGYSGGTMLNVNTDSGGNFSVGSNNAFGTGPVTYVPVAGTSQLSLRSNIATAVLPNAINLGGGLSFNGGNAFQFNGPITVLSTGAATKTISNATGTGQVTYGDGTTPSTITLGSANSAGQNLQFIVSAGTNTVINDSFQNASGATSGGSVTYGLAGSTSFSGTIQINSVSTYTGQTSMAGSSNIRFNHGTTLNGDNTIHDGPFGTGTLRFDNTNNNNLYPIGGGTITIANPITMNFGFTARYDVGDSTNLTFTGPITFLGSGRFVQNIITGTQTNTLTLGASPNSVQWKMPTNASTTVNIQGGGNTIINDQIVENGGGTTIAVSGSNSTTFNGDIAIKALSVTAANANVTLNGTTALTSALSVTANGDTVTVNGPQTGAGALTISSSNVSTQVNLNSSLSTYSGGTNLQGSAYIINIGTSSVGPPGAPTSGPFGTGHINNASGSSTNPHLRLAAPGGANVTIANPVDLSFGITMDTAANSTAAMIFSGPFALQGTSRTIANGFKGTVPNVAGGIGAQMILGDYTTPSTITHGPSGNLNLDYNALAGPIIINDVIQNGTSGNATAGFNASTQNYAPVVIRGANTFSGNATIGQSSTNTFDGAILIGISSAGGTDGAPASGPFGKATLNISDQTGTVHLVPFGADRTIGNPLTMNQSFEVSNTWRTQSTNGADGTNITAWPTDYTGDPLTGLTGNYNLTVTGGFTLGTTSKTLTNNLPTANTLTFGSSPATSQQFKISSTLTMTGIGNNIINEAIVNGTATGSFTLQGSGVTKMTNTNTYTGTTTVTNGTLLVNGANNGTGAVNVNNAGTIGGTGSVKGTLTVGDGTSTATLTPGSPDLNSGIGTLTANTQLIINNNTTLNFELGAALAHDLVSIPTANSLTLPATASSVTLNLTNLVGASLAGGDYPLLDYAGTGFNGSLSSINLIKPTTPGYTFGDLQVDTGNTWIYLHVTAPRHPAIGIRTPSLTSPITSLGGKIRPATAAT